MKKFISVILCLTLLVSAVAFSVSAEEEEPLNLVEDIFRTYGVTAIYASTNINTAPTVDGVVNTGEYTYSRWYTNLTSETREYVDYRDNNNFGVNCQPNNNTVVTEYIAVDEDYLYLAFEFGQDLSDFMLRINPTQNAAYDPGAAHNTLSINFELPEGVDTDDTPDILFMNDITDPDYIGDTDGQNKFGMIYDEDDPMTNEVEADGLDAIAKRNWTDDNQETVKNITAEFKLSKAALLDAIEDEELNYFGYMAKGKRTEAGANCAAGGDVTLQQRLNSGDMLAEGYMKSYELWPDASATARDYYSTYGRLLRFVCFYADPLAPEEGDNTTTEETTTEAEATTTEAEATTTAAATTTKAATTAAATTTVAATTEPAKSGCNKSIALSALAIVPVLGLGVAVVSKKKED